MGHASLEHEEEGAAAGWVWVREAAEPSRMNLLKEEPRGDRRGGGSSREAWRAGEEAVSRAEGRAPASAHTDTRTCCFGGFAAS